MTYERWIIQIALITYQVIMSGDNPFQYEEFPEL